jgi:hypothetical protein
LKLFKLQINLPAIELIPSVFAVYLYVLTIESVNMMLKSSPLYIMCYARHGSGKFKLFNKPIKINYKSFITNPCYILYIIGFNLLRMLKYGLKIKTIEFGFSRTRL